MSPGSSTPPFLKLAILFFLLLLPAAGQDSVPAPKETDAKPQLRFICVSSLAADQKVVFAAKDDEGGLLELGTVELRPSLITQWLPAKAGELHLALREDGALKSVCRFQYPAAARRALVVLIADPREKVYKADAIDPEKLGFAKGSALIVNFSSHTGMVLLGSKKVTVNSGQRAVAAPALESNGMYRLMAAYLDSDQKTVPCYDRYIAGSPDSRDLLFLFPDATLGLKVFSLPLFGEFE